MQQSRSSDTNKSSKLLNFMVNYDFSGLPRSFKGDLFFNLLTSRKPIRMVLLGLGTCFAVSGMTVAYCHKVAIDHLTDQISDYKGAALFFFGAFLLLCSNKSLEVLVRIIGLREANIIETWLSRSLYLKSLKLSYELRADQPVGKTMALMSNHLNMISFFFTDLFPQIFTALVAILIAPLGMVLLFDLNPIGAYAVVFFSLISCFSFAINSSRLFQRYKVLDETRLGYINEWLRNIKVLRTLSWVTSFETRIFDWTKIFTRQRIKMSGWAQLMNSFAESLPHLMNFAGLITLLLSRDQQVTPGEIFGLLWVLGVFLTGPLKTLPWIFVISLDAHASMKRISEFLNLDEDESKNPLDKKIKVPDSDIAISVKGLSLKLNEKAILSNIDLEVKSGEFVCIVGSVGSGKTQLLHALLGAAPCEYEGYKIFEQEVQPDERKYLQQFFTFAPQDPFTLGESLTKNVHFQFDETENEKKLAEKSLLLAAYGPDLDSFPDGAATELGEFGRNLSGGQRQRLGLARAQYFERPIVVLDDSLSAVDSDTEEQLLKDLLEGEWKDQTRILATHRLTVLDHCDRIIFLEDGQISGFGSKSDLHKLERFREFIKSTEGD